MSINIEDLKTGDEFVRDGVVYVVQNVTEDKIFALEKGTDELYEFGR